MFFLFDGVEIRRKITSREVLIFDGNVACSCSLVG